MPARGPVLPARSWFEAQGCREACKSKRAWRTADSHLLHLLHLLHHAGHVSEENAAAMSNWKAFIHSSGLILASGYLATATPIDHSFALDKPLHTLAVLLLLTGVAIVAIEAWGQRTAPPHLPTRYVAIPLDDGHGRRPEEETWTEAGAPIRRRAWAVKAVGALLAALLFTMCGRIAIYYRVMRDVECRGPSLQPFLPLVLALYHSLRHPSRRQYPAWSDARPPKQLDRLLSFVHDGSTRYMLPAALLSISSFLVSVKTSTLRSTYICPVANGAATTVATLEFFAFLIDCLVVLAVYRLVDDTISPADDWTIHLQDGTSNLLLLGLTLIVTPPPTTVRTC